MKIRHFEWKFIFQKEHFVHVILCREKKNILGSEFTKFFLIFTFVIHFNFYSKTFHNKNSENAICFKTR